MSNDRDMNFARLRLRMLKVVESPRRTVTIERESGAARE